MFVRTLRMDSFLSSSKNNLKLLLKYIQNTLYINNFYGLTHNSKKDDKGDLKMLKKITILLSLFFLFSSPTLAIETTGTFRIMNEKNETIETKTVSFHEGETLLEVTKRAFINRRI